MKGCIITLVSRQFHFDFFDVSILSKIAEYKKILIVEHSLANLISNLHRECYDEIQFVSMKKVGAFALYYDSNELETIIKKYCQEFSSEKIYLFAADEYNLETIANVSTKLNINGPNSEKAILFRDKDLMKKYLQKYSKVPVPKHILITKADNYQSLSAQLGKKFVLKPKKEAAAIGVFIVSNADEWNDFLSKNNYDFNDYEAETFLTGALFHIDTVRVNGKNVAVVVSEYIYPVGDYAKGKPVGSILITDDHPAFEALFSLNQDALDAFDVNGCFHLECFMETDKKPVFLEVAWRQAGVPVESSFRQYYNGYTQTLVYIFATLGLPFPEPDRSNFQKLNLLLAKRKGVFHGLDTSILSTKVDIELLVKKGEKMNIPTSYFDLSAKIELTSSNYNSLYSDFLALRKYSLYQ